MSEKFAASCDELLEIVEFIRTEMAQRATVAANDARAEVVNEVIARLGPRKALRTVMVRRRRPRSCEGLSGKLGADAHRVALALFEEVE